MHVNGERVKPSRSIQLDDRLTITREDNRFEIVVTGLPARRGPAHEARKHYAETQASIAAREERQQQARMAPPAPDGRPDKHSRRMLRELRRR